jgi:hypothetical protein
MKVSVPEAGRREEEMRIQISFVWVSGVIAEGPFDQVSLRVF